MGNCGGQDDRNLAEIDLYLRRHHSKREVPVKTPRRNQELYQSLTLEHSKDTAQTSQRTQSCGNQLTEAEALAMSEVVSTLQRVSKPP